MNLRSILTQIMFFLLIVLSLQGCGSQAESPGQSEDSSLTDLIQRIGRGNYATACDRRQHGMKMEIASALDSRTLEIRIFRNSHATVAADYHREQWGSLIVRHRQLTPHRPLDRWRTDLDSWEDIYTFYQRIQNTPINEQWLVLDRNVRFMLSDDESRIIYNDNYHIRRADIPLIPLLITAITSCLNQQNCSTPQLPHELSAFVERIPAYRLQLETLTLATATAEKRSLMQDWLQSVNLDNQRFNFIVNETILRSRSNTLELPLDPGPFSAITAQLSQVIESVWSSPHLNVHIRWVSRNIDSRIFLFEFISGSSGASFVSRSRRVITLFNDINTRSIAHEIGHVLGFRDQYYITWSEDHCAYMTESNDADIMSNSYAGNVMASEWALLESSYP